MLVFLRRGLLLVRQPTTRVLAKPSLRLACLFVHHFAVDTMGEGSAAGKDAKGKGKGKTKAAAADSALVVRDDSYLEAVTQKRIRFFEEIQARQAVERLNIGGEVIK
jgi:threonyl-tRNA synthetase